MGSSTVECLRCGRARPFARPFAAQPHHDAGECPRCGYVGWAYSAELSERTRKLLRDVPLERRFSLDHVA